MAQNVIGFLIIFGASLAGYAGTGPWIVAIATLGLLALSYAERQGLIRRAAEIGITAMADRSLIGSLFNAFCATGAAYAFGALLRVL
jgi:hypothetical protein